MQRGKTHIYLQYIFTWHYTDFVADIKMIANVYTMSSNIPKKTIQYRNEMKKCLGPYLVKWLNLSLAWISRHMVSKVWNEIVVGDMECYFIPYFTIDRVQQ